MTDQKKKIAVVGMACRFPGEATSPEAYWDVLKNGKDVVTEVSSDRWGTDYYKHPNKKEPGKSYTFSAGVLNQVDEFDASFFGISPREASQMDPQQRLLLELTWEALEDGQQIPKSLAGSQCAVYVGIASTDYAHRRMDDLSSLDPYSMTGNTASIASNRISYIFDLHGPSVSVDTACSSSLVALHQACNAIWNGDAPMAITGGVNMLLHPFGFVGFSKASMLSPHGRCRAFDASGDGYVRSEGSAVLFLKPLEDAEADGDPIHAIIVDTGINCDGKTNGITLPSTEGQASLLETMYSRSNIDPNDISYIEAHGTGTAVGDPLEANALSKVLGKTRKSALPIGSAKTNVGHLETASGMAGLMKVILSLKHKKIPPSLHFKEPNPNIDFENDRLSVVTKLTPLDPTDKPLLMGVNSFGFGGANAHAIVEEYPAHTNITSKKKNLVETTKSLPPLFLSAHSQNALRVMAGQYRDLLKSEKSDFNDIAWSTLVSKQKFSHGLAVHANKVDDIVECLHAYSQNEIHTGVTTANQIDAKEKDNNQPKLALVFSGNGSQWQGMGRDLLANEPVFRESVVEIDQLLKEYTDVSLIDEFNAPEEESKLALTEIAQPLLFAMQVGIIKMLESKGMRASAVVGHSVGEVAAAWAAGMLSLDQAVKVIYYRSHAQAKTQGVGRMAAAAMSKEHIASLINQLGLIESVSIAGVNSPKSVTLSGPLRDLERIGEVFEEQGRFYRVLDLDYAFHSPSMDVVKEEIIDSLSDLVQEKGDKVYYSTVTGNTLSSESLDAKYWWDNIRNPVEFSSALSTMMDDGYQVFLEIGPHPVLRTYVNETGQTKDFETVVFSTIKRNSESKTILNNGLFNCYLAGCDFDKADLFDGNEQTVSLPSYPWQREKHWYTLSSEGSDLVNRDREHPLLGYRLNNHEAIWENQVDTFLISYLKDHVVDGGAVMPASAFVEMSLAASSLWFDSSDEKDLYNWEIENLEIRSPIVLDHSKSIRFELKSKDGGFIISSCDRLSDAPWTENVVGRLIGKTNKSIPKSIDIAVLKKNANKTITSQGHYKLTESVGLSYGPTFQGVQKVWVNTHKALAELVICDEIQSGYDKYILHPAMLDAGFQVLVDIFSKQIESGNQAALIPVQVGKLYLYQSMQDLKYLSAEVKKESPQSVLVDYYLLNQNGDVLAELKNCRFRGVQLMRSKSSLPASYEFKPLLMPHVKMRNPSPIVEPAALVSQAVKYLEDHEEELQRDRHYQEVLPLFDLMVSMFIWQALHELNPKGDEFTVESLAEQAHIESTKFPLIHRFLEILVEDDLATYENGQWLLASNSDLPSAEDIWLSVLGDSPAYLPELMLLGRCGKHLTDVLQNRVDVKSLLFSEKSSIQDHWSGASPSNLSMNLALRNIVQDIVSEWPANRRIRVLEIGGSNTELSQLILPILPDQQSDYLYIHQDDSALSKVAFDLEAWPFVNTKVVDFNQKLTSESLDIDFGTYDIVIAANTLYHSDDYANVQNNIKNALTADGVFLLFERESDRFMDMTFGLQSDWWVHTAEDENPVPLLMTANTWRKELKDTGFDQVELLVEPEATGDVGAFLVIAKHHNDLKTEFHRDLEETSSSEIETWLILKDKNKYSYEIAQQLEQKLKNHGHQLVIVESGKTYKRLGPLHFSVNFDSESRLDEEKLEHVFDTLEKHGISCDHIVHLLGFQWHDENEFEDLSIQNKRCISTIDLIQGLELIYKEHFPKLHLVTSGGATINPEDEHFSFSTNPNQASLWGLGRVVMNEHPHLSTRLIDLQGSYDLDKTSKLLFDELVLNDFQLENEIIIHPQVRHVSRMIRNVSLQDIKKKDQNLPEIDYALSFSVPGQLKNLYWQSLPDRFLQSDEIQIKPHAAGLNFRDVMYAMGLLSDEAVENGFAGPTLGMEVSGTVMKVGSAVNEFTIGDEVVGFAPACFSSRVITQTTAITHKPEGWSFEEATTIPTTFFTVYYALKHLAQIQEGEKILIHGAAGGVGIAAIQYARYCGAEIFATAGSDEKRDFVKLLGADHVMDSRSLAFADQIMEITEGGGIDIVLNSLAGEAITRNLSVLKPFGRFLELGKRDFYENSKIGLRPFRNNISYFGIDADQLLIERPELANRLFKEMMELFDDESLRPMPYRSFPANRIQDAFRYMQQSRQVGKVVVSFENGNAIPKEEVVDVSAQEESFRCDPNASYLITGGVSGFGLKTASWLAEKGATALILISRSAKVSDEDQITLHQLKEEGIEVFIRACDVTDKKALAILFAEAQSTSKPIKGVIHAAMVLDDGLIRNMSQQQVIKVMRPKINGSWNLHEVTKEINLDFFVMYSSATTFVGNPGQANYVAANSYMESLANLRKSKGLPASFVAWGAISDVGFLARNEETKDALQSRLGGEALHSDKALKMLEKVILSEKTGAAVIDLDWGAVQKVMPAANSAKYEELKRHVKASDNDQFEDIQTLIANLNHSEIQELVVDLLLDEIEQILRLPREKLDIEQSIFDLGMDSLMGMELVLAIEDRFGVKLPVMALTEGANILRIAERITDQLSDTEDHSESDMEQKNIEHHESISVAASRHGHAETMTEEEAAELSRKLIEDVMKH